MIEKPTPKKRGRKPGSKNGSRKLFLTTSQVDLAKKLGIPLEVYAQETLRMREENPAKASAKGLNYVNWQKLAKDLDKALKDEIAENAKHEEWCLEWRKKYDDLEEKNKKLSNVFAIKEIKLRGIIDYLEDKIRGNNPV